MAKKKKEIKNNFGLIKYLQIAIVVVFLVLGALLIYNLAFIGKIFPNIYVSNVEVSGVSTDQAVTKLSEKIKPPEKIKAVSSQESFDLDIHDIELKYDFQKSAQRAFDFTRSGNMPLDLLLRLSLPLSKRVLGLSVTFNEDKVNKFISVIEGQVVRDPVYPFASFKDGELIINKGEKGTTLDSKLLRAKIGESLSLNNQSDIQIPLLEIDPTLNDKEQEEFRQLATKYLDKSIELHFEYDSFKFDDNQILSFLDPKGGFREDNIKNEIYEIAQKINRESQEPKFDFENGKVTEFLPAKDGITLDSEKLLEIIKSEVSKLETTDESSVSINIPVTKTSPSITTDKVNNMGIKELIGRGTSTYFHSIPGRVHNVALAASRINGTLVAPGETFSFNKTLGDVSKFTGYKEAYVIQNGKTVLGDGGGVCQVSTTLFRATLNAGLPIEERRAHAYRVGYYEQDSPPGIDATVFDPSPDFKFTNDTPSHILIIAKADSKKYTLVFELYGTSDERVSTIYKPVVSQVIAPPPDLYQDDPTLPVGTVKQIDYKAWGAKVSFNYSVTRNGSEIYKKTFVSNYRPWQAIYLRGTAPVAN